MLNLNTTPEVPAFWESKGILLRTATTETIKSQIQKSSTIPLVLFNGALKSFITKPTLMRIPVGQKGFNRGYGVKRLLSATLSTKSVTLEIENLLSAAGDINLELSQFSLNEILDIYIDIIDISQNIISTNMEIKMTAGYQVLKRMKVLIWITAGLSDFSLVVQKKQTQIYAMAYLQKDKSLSSYESSSSKSQSQLKELVISTQPDHAAIKSTNYCANCYVATHVKVSFFFDSYVRPLIIQSKGGYIGIHCNKQGEMLQGSMANVAIVMSDTKQFILPPFDVTLPGTTSKRCLAFIEKILIPEGLVSVIRRESIHHENVKQNASQVLFLGGDACVPVLQLDGVKISQERGPVAKKLQELLQNDKKELNH